ncbi:unnamed protein product [Echinostoma caproni]|uniref:Integrase, catalytic region, zinc finger, CCHC-type, peptidase aspartic, catalytic n=1 Tax=Echinostoma caproni TaxID=27848 RepID=A0A183AHP8_9TREM|nr:unnamed protein product [Echinostoma caproni]
MRDVETSTPCKSIRSGQDQAVQCYVRSSPSGNIDISEQPTSKNPDEWMKSMDDVNHVIALISDIESFDHKILPEHVSSTAISSDVLPTFRSTVSSNLQIGISLFEIDSESQLGSTAPVMSSLEQELLDDLFFQAY